jgi:LPXTG-motif cell wall-anchored protein
MRRVATVLIAAGLLVGVLPASPAFAKDVPIPTDGSVNNTTHADDYGPWMQHIDNDVPLTNLSIPGTHDSGTVYLGGEIVPASYYHDQSLTLLQQLNAGIRFLDIRILCETFENKYAMVVFHGQIPGFDMPIDSTHDITEVVKEVQEFLTGNPSETVIMQISKAGEPSDLLGDCYQKIEPFDSKTTTRDIPANVDFKFDTMFGALWSEISGHFALPPDPCTSMGIPTLGEVRGKIVMEQGFDSLKTCPGPHQVKYGMEDYGGEFYSDPNAYLDAGYDCKPKVPTLEEKYENYIVANIVRATNNVDGTGMMGTWTQLSNPDPSDCEPASTSIKNASIMNPMMLKFLGPIGIPDTDQVGIVAMDWPGPALIAAVLAHNASLNPEKFGFPDPAPIAAPVLPATGTEDSPLPLLLGMLLLVSGAVVLVLGRRRRA